MLARICRWGFPTQRALDGDSSLGVQALRRMPPSCWAVFKSRGAAQHRLQAFSRALQDFGRAATLLKRVQGEEGTGAAAQALDEGADPVHELAGLFMSQAACLMNLGAHDEARRLLDVAARTDARQNDKIALQVRLRLPSRSLTSHPPSHTRAPRAAHRNRARRATRAGGPRA